MFFLETTIDINFYYHRFYDENEIKLLGTTP